MLQVDFGAVAYGTIWGYGVGPPSDTQTGKFPLNQTPLEHAGGPPSRAGRPLPRRAVPASPRGEAAMTAPLITPVIPPTARPGARGHGRPGAARRLPVAAVPVIPAAPDDVAYGFGRIDASGRVADRAYAGHNDGGSDAGQPLAQPLHHTPRCGHIERRHQVQRGRRGPGLSDHVDVRFSGQEFPHTAPDDLVIVEEKHADARLPPLVSPPLVSFICHPFPAPADARERR